MSGHTHTNALAGETSPYLLQHAHNPVHWYPWSAEALQKSRDEDRPILLSIGYSACHWCHVMERESFESEDIAQIMNDNFINIKVDREERPDLDAIYMTAVQMITGSGGWPMTVFLTPELAPFFAGTYFPPEDRHGMAGFPRVLSSVARAYRENKEAILHDARQVLEALRKSNRLSVAPAELSTAILDEAVSGIMSGYDSHYGGFGGAPKFPPSMALMFLLRSYSRTGLAGTLGAVEHTLDMMARGGIYDQIGGGFHRYSVDQYWLVPHFEKMLYDNALLSRAFLEGYLLTRKPVYRRVAEETIDYVLREMTSAEGGFYSTQDADSEGVEGKFYVWTPGEVRAALGEEEAELFCRYFDISPEGNFEGKNILNVPRTLDLFAKVNNLDPGAAARRLDTARTVLLQERAGRAKPARDDKNLASWNALMLRSLAEAANALQRDDYTAAAVRNATFLMNTMSIDGRLLHSYKDGRASHSGFLEDYGFVLDALLAVYECTFDSSWISESVKLAEALVGLFWDGTGAFYSTAHGQENLIYRPRDLYDSAMPSGNSAAVFGLLRLAEYTGDRRWEGYAVKVLQNMTDQMAKHPTAFGYLLCGLDFHLSPPREIAVVGDPAESRTRELLRTVYDRFLPNKVVICGTNSQLPLLANRDEVDGSPTAYVCHNYSCTLPVTEAGQLAAQLGH